MTLEQKFRPYLDILRSAACGDVTLDVEHPALYNKVLAFYQRVGIDFYGDPDEDYELLANYLYDDLSYA
jgi:hypothetical protein